MTILLKELKKTLKKHYDVFLTSASYEKRCLSIMDAVNNVIDFNYKFVSLSIPHKDLMKENLEIFKRNKFVIIEINNAEQVKTATNFIEHIGQVLNENPKATFLVDITTFTKQTLLILLRILRESLYESNQIQFLYTPAEEYSIGLEYADKWLSRGVIKVNSILGFAGIIKPSNLYHLVILMGYEVERAAALINAYEPSKISVGYARKDDSISDAHYQINKLKLSGIYKFFDEDKIIISRNKSTFKLVEKMGTATVVDDWPEVIDYLSQYPQITPIWLNLLDNKKHKTAKTIHSLGELLNETN